MSHDNEASPNIGLLLNENKTSTWMLGWWLSLQCCQETRVVRTWLESVAWLSAQHTSDMCHLYSQLNTHYTISLSLSLCSNTRVDKLSNNCNQTLSWIHRQTVSVAKTVSHIYTEMAWRIFDQIYILEWTK